MTEEEFRTGKGVAHSFDYMAECDKTCSTVFKPEQVEMTDMRYVLQGVVGFANDLNLIKKLLFRGKTREELNFPPSVKPTVADLIQTLSEKNEWSPADIDTLHGAVGVITEAGEVAEYLLKFLSGQPFDKVNVMEEAGDLLWYVARSFRGIGVSMEQGQRSNIDKLHGRHGEAFDVFRDANRDLEAERGKLEDDFLKAAPETPLFDNVEVVKNPEPSGERAEMAERIREVNNADSVGVKSGRVSYGERPGPIGGCEGQDC